MDLVNVLPVGARSSQILVQYTAMCYLKWKVKERLLLMSPGGGIHDRLVTLSCYSSILTRYTLKHNLKLFYGKCSEISNSCFLCTCFL